MFDSRDNLVSVDQRDDMESRISVNMTSTLGNFDFAKDFQLQLSIFNIFDADTRDPDPTGSLLDDIPRSGRSYLMKVSYGF